MPIIFQAKEQGKAEVEELLSKLEKVTRQFSCFSVCFKMSCLMKPWLDYFLFSDQFWAASENTWASGQAVQGTQMNFGALSKS